MKHPSPTMCRSRLLPGWIPCFFLLLATLAFLGCNDSGGGDGGVLSGTWRGFTISATNGISVTRDQIMKLRHSGTDNITGTQKTGSEKSSPLVGTYYPASSIMEITVATREGNRDEVWRLEEGGGVLTQVSGGNGQVFRE
ncbi:MAG TPA: hypothetical protein PKC67_02015 [Kiritimatiellia bacterium]|nr:hypothetical protein [Kiritimatiellia bacterium]HMP33100.1 hypothetical protein [Kiritimatiellia bacterium]